MSAVVAMPPVKPGANNTPKVSPAALRITGHARISLERLPVSSSRKWLLRGRTQPQPMARHLFHPGARERQWEVFPLLPQGQQIGVVRAAGLAGLAGGASRQ